MTYSSAFGGLVRELRITPIVYANRLEDAEVRER
jgi:hypothetical protein